MDQQLAVAAENHLRRVHAVVAGMLGGGHRHPVHVVRHGGVRLHHAAHHLMVHQRFRHHRRHKQQQHRHNGDAGGEALR